LPVLPPGRQSVMQPLLLSMQGIIHCGQTISKEEGTRALWKGLTPFATHLTLKYALRMGSNSVYQNLLRSKVLHARVCVLLR
jgi:hypothetical protein